MAASLATGPRNNKYVEDKSTGTIKHISHKMLYQGEVYEIIINIVRGNICKIGVYSPTSIKVCGGGDHRPTSPGPVHVMSAMDDGVSSNHQNSLNLPPRKEASQQTQAQLASGFGKIKVYIPSK